MNAVQEFLKDKSYRSIIWDWNGTLLDDFHCCHEILSDFMAEHGLPKISKEKHRDIFQFPIYNFYLSLGFDFGQKSYELMTKDFMKVYLKKIYDCSLFAEVEEFLSLTQQMGISHSILSASSEDDLKNQVLHHNISQYFDHICGLDNHHAASKVERGIRFMTESGISSSQTLMIGDTDHDLEVGKAMGVDVLLIAEGHQAYSRLSRVHSQVLKSRVL